MSIPEDYAPKFDLNCPCVLFSADYSSMKSAYVIIKASGDVVMGFGVDTTGYAIVRLAASYILTD
jgi:hypothetical protein